MPGMPGMPPVLPGLPGGPLPGMPGGPQYSFGVRVDNSRPAPMRPMNESENMPFVKPKSHPTYNGMREGDNLPGT